MKDRAIVRQASGMRHGGRMGALACLAGAMGALLSGCSLSVPMSATPDDLSTGTIRPTSPSPFSAEMDAEDWRRAKSALDTALDPQGNGASVTWDNPASGAKGSFVPLAQVYPKGDGICRNFAAHLILKGQSETVLQSSACRVNSGQWVVGHVGPLPDGKSRVSNRS
jgi:surface antigen